MVTINVNDKVKVKIRKDKIPESFSYLLNRTVDSEGYTEMQLHEWADLHASGFQGLDPMYDPEIVVTAYRTCPGTDISFSIKAEKKTYEELNRLSLDQLHTLKRRHFDRIAVNEEARQEIIKSILLLQNINEQADFRR